MWVVNYLQQFPGATREQFEISLNPQARGQHVFVLCCVVQSSILQLPALNPPTPPLPLPPLTCPPPASCCAACAR
jgi:hypothetical protein